MGAMVLGKERRFLTLARYYCKSVMVKEGVVPVEERRSQPVTGLLLLGFICLGILLRIYNFSKDGLWIDEYTTWWVIAGTDWGEVARRAFYFQGQSPFYYFIVKLSSDLFGVGIASLRLPSILFGIGVLTLAYPVALRTFHDRHAALLALAAFAVNEPLIYFSQDARPYSLPLLCAMLSFFFYLSLLAKERLSSRIGYLLATAGAYYANYLLCFVMVIHVIHLCVARGWSWLRSRAWRITFALLAVLCLPGTVQMFAYFKRRPTWDDLEPTGIFGPVKLAVDFLNPWVFFPLVLVVVAIHILTKERDKRHCSGLDLVLVWFLSPILFFGAIPPLFGITLLRKRYVLVAIPGAILFVAWVMAAVRKTFWQKWIPLLVFFSMTFAWTLLPAFRANGTFSRRPEAGWNMAAAFLGKKAQDGDLVVYRTGFIEADQLALPNPDPLLPSFVGWPLAAHLSSNHRFQMVGLPYGKDPQTAPYISSVLKKATESRRIWIIGRGSLLTGFAEALLGTERYKVRRHIIFDGVLLMLLDQNSEGSQRSP